MFFYYPIVFLFSIVHVFALIFAFVNKWILTQENIFDISISIGICSRNNHFKPKCVSKTFLTYIEYNFANGKLVFAMIIIDYDDRQGSHSSQLYLTPHFSISIHLMHLMPTHTNQQQNFLKFWINKNIYCTWRLQVPRTSDIMMVKFQKLFFFL